MFLKPTSSNHRLSLISSKKTGKKSPPFNHQSRIADITDQDIVENFLHPDVLAKIGGLATVCPILISEQ